jgi:hypothetical protein
LLALFFVRAKRFGTGGKLGLGMFELLCDLVFVGFVVFIAESDTADHSCLEFFLFRLLQIKAETDERVSLKRVRSKSLVVEHFTAQMRENETFVNEVEPG